MSNNIHSTNFDTNKYHTNGGDYRHREDYYTVDVDPGGVVVVPSIPAGKRRLYIFNRSHELATTDPGYMQPVWIFKNDLSSATPQKGCPIGPLDKYEMMREDEFLGEIRAISPQGVVPLTVALTQS